MDLPAGRTTAADAVRAVLAARREYLLAVVRRRAGAQVDAEEVVHAAFERAYAAGHGSQTEEAINHAAAEMRRIQAKYGRDSIGGITSSRCTNEETFLVQKLVRAGFGNNNVDTCARVCHSPTGRRPKCPSPPLGHRG